MDRDTLAEFLVDWMQSRGLEPTYVVTGFMMLVLLINAPKLRQLRAQRVIVQIRALMLVAFTAFMVVASLMMLFKK